MGLLKDLLVLDLADEQGSFCSRLLALFGATVVRLEAPGGDPSRDKCPSSYFCENGNKFLTSVDLRTATGKERFRGLLGKADVLIETFRHRDLEPLGLSRTVLSRMNPRLIHLAITPFGRSGPRRDYHSSDAVASAFGGQMYVSGKPHAPPVRLFGAQSHYTASLFGAVAVLLRLKKRELTGKGSYIDLSIQEAVASTLDHVLIDFFQEGKVARRGEGDQRGDFVILPSSDGYVQITVLRNWDTLVELMASEGMAGGLLGKEWREPAYREEHLDEIIAVIGRWTSRHRKHELFELGQAMGFPWASIDSADEVVGSSQLASRKFFAHMPTFEGGPAIAVPGLPCKFSLYSPPPLKPPALLPGEFTWDVPGIWGKKIERRLPADEKILEGLRVLDLTRMLSGPYATRVLGDFGAEVIKIQSQKTAQGAENNDTAYFSAWNRNKRSITLDLDLAYARADFLRLVSRSEVVVENFSPRVMANWGLDYERLREVNPDLVMVSISAMGHTGPWKDFLGFAPTFHALSGLISATYGRAIPPAGIGYAYGDVIAGLYAALATLCAVKYRAGTGKGQHVDLSAYEAMCTFLGPAYLGPKLVQSRISNLESQIFKCAGVDRWCVVTVSNEKERAELDSLVGGFASQTAEDAVEQLQNAGIAAGVVQDARDLAGDKQLQARRFFVSLDHPTLGKVIAERSALWNWRERPKHWKASPLLGEHNGRFGIRDSKFEI